jgi:hypothetical protein
MIPDNVSGAQGPLKGAAQLVVSPAAPAVAAPGRVDLLRVLTGLRHLAGSTEPGRVFAELAEVCVPALCDDVIVDIEEDGGHRYRIRRPGSSPATGATTGDLRAEPGAPEIRFMGRSVIVRVGALPGGGPDYTARLFCSWHTGYTPTEADAALVGVLADHATAVVHRERATARLADTDGAHQVGATLGDAQRVAAATGVLMALHHLNPAQARQLLARAGDRTHRSLIDVADTVLQTGGLPAHPATQADNPPAPAEHPQAAP